MRIDEFRSQVLNDLRVVKAARRAAADGDTQKVADGAADLLMPGHLFALSSSAITETHLTRSAGSP